MDKIETSAKWNAEHMRGFAIRLRVGSDDDVIRKLESVENKTDYIRGLIRKDINK